MARTRDARSWAPIRAVVRAPFRAPALAVLVALGVTAAACGSAPVARAVHPAPTSTTTVPTTTSTTTAVPSAVPTTVPTPVVPVVGWSTPATTLPPAGGFTGASCISDVFCLAVGGGANEADATDSTGPGTVSSWDGATWTTPATYFAAPAAGPATAPELPAIACTDGPRCLVVDGSGHAAVGDGTNWTPPVPLAAAPATTADPTDPGPDHPGSRSAAVDCPTSAVCAYVDNTGHVATLQGTSWSPTRALTTRQGSANVELFQTGRVGLSCGGPSACTALIGDTTIDWDGTSWSTGPGPWPAGATGDSAVACPAPGTCLAVRGTSVSLRVAGAGWTAPRVIDPDGGLDALSCPTAAFCMAADRFGNVVRLSDGTWSAPSKVVPTPVDYAGDGTTLSCPTDQFCLVLSGDGDYATYQGPDAQAVPAPPAPSP